MKLNHTNIKQERYAMNRVEINGVDCYGNLTDSSNIELLFDDEMMDFVWLTRDPALYPDWESIVEHWQSKARYVGCELLEMVCDE
jgi:hypothetical protein